MLHRIIGILILFGGYYFISSSIGLIYPPPGDKEICAWGYCVIDIPGTLASKAQYGFTVLMIKITGFLITLSFAIIIWKKGLPSKGGRFGGLSK